MPTDEQLRVQSEKWATADHMKDLWDELKARDAEVQALRGALERADAVMLLAEYLPEKEVADAD